ncbi:hypothetical protein Misp05_60430 [Micromonospora sp. NBRC 107095]|nr:hypothetical protein Misp05_60430 [Micromonospora sp. NBRC 107095]
MRWSTAPTVTAQCSALLPFPSASGVNTIGPGVVPTALSQQAIADPTLLDERSIPWKRAAQLRPTGAGAGRLGGRGRASPDAQSGPGRHRPGPDCVAVVDLADQVMLMSLHHM